MKSTTIHEYGSRRRQAEDRGRRGRRGANPRSQLRQRPAFERKPDRTSPKHLRAGKRTGAIGRPFRTIGRIGKGHTAP